MFDVRRGGANHRPLGRYDWRRIDKMPSLLQPRMGRPAHRTAIRTGAHRSGVRHRRAGTAQGARRDPDTVRASDPATPAETVDWQAVQSFLHEDSRQDERRQPGLMTVRHPQGSGNKTGSGTSQPPRSTTSGSRKGPGNRRGGGASQPPRSMTGRSPQGPGNRRGGGYRLPVTIAVGAMIAVVGVVYSTNEDVRSRVDDFIGRRSGAPASPTETPVDIERQVQAAVAAAQAPSSPAPDVQSHH